MRNDEDPFGGFYSNSTPVPVFSGYRKEIVPVETVDLFPNGCITAKVLHSLASKLIKLEMFQRRQTGKMQGTPCLRLIQGSRNGRITALVHAAGVTLKLVLRGDDWVVLGDALKVSD